MQSTCCMRNLVGAEDMYLGIPKGAASSGPSSLMRSVQLDLSIPPGSEVTEVCISLLDGQYAMLHGQLQW
eukprot:339338-Amphidinium_carterae.2